MAYEEPKDFYRILVFEPEYDADDVALVDGIVHLDERASWDLASRLERLVDAGFIAKFELDRYDTPAVFTVDGIFNFIAGIPDDPDNRRDEVEPHWNGTAVIDPYEEFTDEQKRAFLAEAEAEFEAAGGRGVELAEEIDGLRRSLGIRS